MKRVGLIFLLSCIVLSISLTEARGYGPNDKKKKFGETIRTIDLAVERPKGDKMRGPATITFYNVNVLRYDVEIGTDVKFTDGPKLDVPFIPGGGQGTQSKTTDKAADKTTLQAENLSRSSEITEKVQGVRDEQTLGGKWKEIQESLTQAEEQVTGIRKAIAMVSGNLNDVSRETLGLVATSDAILKTSGTGGGAKALVEAISDKLLNDISSALEDAWPNDLVLDLVTNLQILDDQIIALPTLFPQDWNSWYASNHIGYDDVKKRVESMLTSVKAMDSMGDEAKKFLEAKDTLSKWHDILQGIKKVGESAFTRTFHVDCGFAFDQNKETTVKVVLRDRISKTTPTTDSKDSSSKTAAADTKQGEIEIGTVICSSPFSISGGFGFSTIEEKEFVFVQSQPDPGSTAKTVNRFGFKNQSSFRVIPLILLNTRLLELSDLFAIHASAGVGVDVKTGQAGTDIEYFVGPSLSFRRSFFITPALHIGRVPSLAGGFKLGDVVPDGVSSPPVEKTWKRAFALTFTYKIK